jgi:SAM-dependent methyltransferase
MPAPRKQKSIWQKEHETSHALPSHDSPEPSSGVVLFLDFLKAKGVRPAKANAIDVGCGKGRNATYLALKGFEVWAIDYIPLAIQRTKELANNSGVGRSVHVEVAAIDRNWMYPDNSFDVAIDSFASIDIETLKGRETCRNEMFRTLKPGGYALVTVFSSDDELEAQMIAKTPGPEKNSSIWPNGKFQKDYDEAELRVFYKQFEVVELKKLEKPAVKLGRKYTATNYWLALRKPKKQIEAQPGIV